MGKKKSRATETSKGERRNVSKSVTKVLRREYIEFNYVDRINNQTEAFRRGKNVVVTIPNPNPNETNKRFIRVNAKDVWKSNNKFMMKQNTSEGV
jgi:hypothetical protein